MELTNRLQPPVTDMQRELHQPLIRSERCDRCEKMDEGCYRMPSDSRCQEVLRRSEGLSVRRGEREDWEAGEDEGRKEGRSKKTKVSRLSATQLILTQI